MTPEEAINKMAETDALLLELLEQLRGQVAQMQRDAEVLYGYLSSIVSNDVEARLGWGLLQMVRHGTSSPLKAFPGSSVSAQQAPGGVGLGVRNTNGNNS
jgi:hypothetical protein